MDLAQVKLTVVSAGVFQVDFVSTISDYHSALVEYGATSGYGTALNARGDGNGNYVGGFETTLTAFHYKCTVTDNNTPALIDNSGDLTYGVVAPPSGGNDGDDTGHEHGRGEHGRGIDGHSGEHGRGSGDGRGNHR